MNQELILKAATKIAQVYDRANQRWGRTFPLPKWEFKKMGRTAGKAMGNNTMLLNPILFQENVETFLERTIPHEIGHLITYQLFPGAKGHGKEWRFVCREIGMKDITRCHSYDTTNARVRRSTKTEMVFCDCKTYKVTPKVFGRITNGAKYICRNCKSACNPVQ